MHTTCRTSIHHDNPWKLQQIQDAANHLQQAIGHIDNVDKHYIFRCVKIDPNDAEGCINIYFFVIDLLMKCCISSVVFWVLCSELVQLLFYRKRKPWMNSWRVAIWYLSIVRLFSIVIMYLSLYFLCRNRWIRIYQKTWPFHSIFNLTSSFLPFITSVRSMERCVSISIKPTVQFRGWTKFCGCWLPPSKCASSWKIRCGSNDEKTLNQKRWDIEFNFCLFLFADLRLFAVQRLHCWLPFRIGHFLLTWFSNKRTLNEKKKENRMIL